MYKNYIKRIVDFSMALVGLVIAFPILLLVTVLLGVVNHGKPFFLQIRSGLNEQLFKIIKFKTMTDKKDAAGKLLPDAERLTIIGNVIRKTSIDELPQLLNVLKGEMSLVGPRPLLPEYLDLYTNEQKQRHSIRPGITGWAQVNGRNTITWKRKFELDVWYVNNISCWLDLKILIKTVLKVIKSEGVRSGSKIAMNNFNGKN